MILTKNISREDFYNVIYKTINPILDLSNTELAILSNFASIRANLIQSNLTPSQIDAANFNSNHRKLVASTLDMSKFNLNNYIMGLRKKGILVYNSNKKLVIQPNIFPNINTIIQPFKIEYKFNIL